MNRKQEVLQKIRELEKAAFIRQQEYIDEPFSQLKEQRERNKQKKEKTQKSQESYNPTPMESLLEFNFPPNPPGRPQTVSLPLRGSLDRLLPKSSSFTLTSGILLWGQVHTVFAGSVNHVFQGNAEVKPAVLLGGTIKQHLLRYRSVARNCKWKVRKVFSSKYSEGVREGPIHYGWNMDHYGWIMYHEDVDSLEAVER